MDRGIQFLRKGCEVGAEIIKCEDNSLIVEIEDLFESEKIVKVGRNAFSDLRSLEEVRLGRYVREIDNNAFYNCRSLRTIELWDSLRSVGDGAFRNCEKLEKIILHVEEGRTSCVRDILGECQREMILELLYENEPVRLLFPEFEIEYQAEGFTLSVHFTAIEHGSGYAYRQCMQGVEIDYRSYDRLFERSAREDRGTVAAAIALLRLRYPRGLLPVAREAYRDWLKGHAVDAVHRILEDDEPQLLDFLQVQGVFTADNISECLVIAKDAGDPTVTAKLLLIQMEMARLKADLLPHMRKRERYEL